MEENNTKDFIVSNLKILSSKYRLQIILLFLGAIFVTGGFVLEKMDLLGNSKIEVLNATSSANQKIAEVVVEVSGAVEKPGVYHLSAGSRVEDALILSGGINANANRSWLEKNLNRAQKLTDGQKIFIPVNNENSQSAVLSASNNGGGENVAQFQNTPDSNLVNINTASLNELDSLTGIGPVYAQKIVDNRPYSDASELLSKKVIPSSTYEKIKNSVSVY